jgi:hypothetical protein
MSCSISVTAFASKDSEEFKKHYGAVKFCIENGLSYPKETSEFFKGKVAGDDLEDISEDCILGYIKDGVEISLDDCMVTDHEDREVIQVGKIPKSVDRIIVEYR